MKGVCCFLILAFCVAGVQLAALRKVGDCFGGLVYCFVEQCQFAMSCAAYPDATCHDNYCGGCHADWYVNDVKVDCHLAPVS